ncbi:hypothetical protein F7725_002728 [Dissostichus mawsoni]|uniref:Uncharacterized protein n=1 Tax=Dissostichus mawsoni TaxID=36200 RepID=A0A7J5Y513_DISMA|nr:hypothetical protein F7725_002728 [Dissostichus mawsoni]
MCNKCSGCMDLCVVQSNSVGSAVSAAAQQPLHMLRTPRVQYSGTSIIRMETDEEDPSVGEEHEGGGQEDGAVTISRMYIPLSCASAPPQLRLKAVMSQ